MNLDQATAVIQANIDAIRSFGVIRIGIFGSVARGEAGPRSDVDILVAFEGLATFRRFMGLKFFLEEILARPVDLVTEEGLKPRARPIVERDLVLVA